MRPRAILFDWDGTLVDGWAAVTAAFNAVQAHFGRPSLSRRETIAQATASQRDLFPLLFGDRAGEARDLFYSRYAALHQNAVQPLADAEQVLGALAKQAIPLAVVSNKRGDFLRREVSALGWADRFGAVIGAQDAIRDKPDAAPALLALDALGLESETPSADIWFVGDTIADVHCAVAAGCVPVWIENADAPPLPSDGPQPRHRLRGLFELIDIALC